MLARRIVPFLLATGGILGLLGCNSGSNDGTFVPGVPITRDITINLSDAQDVDHVIVYHQVGSQTDSLWDPVIQQDFTGQSNIVIHIRAITGDLYRVEAETVDPVDRSLHYSFRDFVPDSNSTSGFSYVQPGFRSRAAASSGALSVRELQPEPSPSGRVRH